VDEARAALLAELVAHPVADAAEGRHRAAMVALVRGSEACFDRTHYRPGHITGSAFVVDRLRRRVLLHEHRRLGRWLQLGGHDDGDRDPLATALREAREESGLTDLTALDGAILDLDVHVIPAHGAEPAHEHHDVRYALATESPLALDPGVAESQCLMWFTFEDAAARLGEDGGRRALSRLARLV
jgi:8-oxo-dGTP pyrophosphatase MutT (NUDIX family)